MRRQPVLLIAETPQPRKKEPNNLIINHHSLIVYDVLRFLRERLSGGGVAVGGECSFSLVVSGYVICVDSSSSSSSATTSGERSCGWVGSDSVRELGADLLGV